MNIKNVKIKIQKWDLENDVLDSNQEPLFNANHKIAQRWSNWAYALHTSIGIFRKSIHSSNYRDDLILITDTGEYCISENVKIYSNWYHKKFMIVVCCNDKRVFLIDSRGIMFELSDYVNYKLCKYYTSITCNRKMGHYKIGDDLEIKYRNNIETKIFEEKIKGNENALVNEKFNTFIEKNKNNSKQYLYLTCGESKCGYLVDYFIKQGIKYEIIPNILKDDDTINIRIPLNGINKDRDEIRFLCIKYNNDYKIYNVSIKQVLCGLLKSGAYLQEEKSTIVYYIINTLKYALKINDDYELHQHLYNNFVRHTINCGFINPINTEFFKGVQYLRHPKDKECTDEYIYSNRDYINKLLLSNGYDIIENKINLDYYEQAYKIAKVEFKNMLQRYESDILVKIAENGGKISRWKPEVDLFKIVKKEYSNAIYQYRPKWLNSQSLDIFIPNLNIGIEYQGKQHYEPVTFFGGDEGYKKTVERDKRKEVLCKKNNINLIKWKYDEVINVQKLREKIKSLLQIPE